MVELLPRFDSYLKPGGHTLSKTKTPTTHNCAPALELSLTTHSRATSPDLSAAEQTRINRRERPLQTNILTLWVHHQNRVVVSITWCCYLSPRISCVQFGCALSTCSGAAFSTCSLSCPNCCLVTRFAHIAWFPESKRETI